MRRHKERIAVTSKRQITLPASICRELGIDRGDSLEIGRKGREIRLRLVPRFPPLTSRSSLFRMLGRGAGRSGPGARAHDQILAAESARRRGPRAGRIG
jgi:AbrB family looped-hinge helix DNA binding protein